MKCFIPRLFVFRLLLVRKDSFNSSARRVIVVDALSHVWCEWRCTFFNRGR